MARKRPKVVAHMTGRAIIPEATDLDPQAATVMPDGRVMQKTVFALTAEQVAKIRAGYVCVKCLEEYTSAFPDECSVCHFPMRERQTEELAKDFRGEIAFGPSTTLDDERGIMNEMRERERYDRLRKQGVVLPNWY